MKYLWIAIFLVTLLWSGIDPKDRITWYLEVAPAIAGAVALALTYRSFKLTGLVYGLILFHCIVLMVGGHYTYAEVPFFDGLFGDARNNYDKLGHFTQGFVPALIAREVFIRNHVVPNAYWRNFLVVCFCLAFSAFYELIEWAVALASGEDAVAFLGTQGYVWDTQSDMGYALVGAIVGLLSLGWLHDRQLREIGYPHAA
jgi:putative membrane protein